MGPRNERNRRSANSKRTFNMLHSPKYPSVFSYCTLVSTCGYHYRNAHKNRHCNLRNTLLGTFQISIIWYPQFKSGRLAGNLVSKDPGPAIYDAVGGARIEDGVIYLPFDLSDVVDNLHREAYVEEWRHGALSSLSKPYYFIRPLLPVGVRRHLQKLYLRGWDKLPFPRWPVDCSVDNLIERLLILTLQATGADRIPFIWFWPDGHRGCALMTHDVETEIGRDFCPTSDGYRRLIWH